MATSILCVIQIWKNRSNNKIIGTNSFSRISIFMSWWIPGCAAITLISLQLKEFFILNHALATAHIFFILLLRARSPKNNQSRRTSTKTIVPCVGKVDLTIQRAYDLMMSPITNNAIHIALWMNCVPHPCFMFQEASWRIIDEMINYECVLLGPPTLMKGFIPSSWWCINHIRCPDWQMHSQGST